MKRPTLENHSAIGVDIGTSRVVIAQRQGNDERFDSQLNAFVTVPFSGLTESSLKREHVPYTRSNGHLVVYGNESGRLADLLGQEIRRPMTRGLLNPDEPESQAQLREILGSMLGQPIHGSPKICFSVPATPLGSDENLTYHEAAVRQIFQELGFTDLRSVNEGLAVVYGELEDANYSGIGISFGGGLCNVAVAYLSVPVLSFSIGKGGDFIDTNAAAVTGDLVNRVRIAKEENFHFNGFFSDKLRQALTVYYDDMIQSTVDGLRDAFQSTKHVPKLNKPVPVVLSGGGVLPAGFAGRFERAIRSANLPVAISEVRLAQRPLEATARGALMAALSE